MALYAYLLLLLQVFLLSQVDAATSVPPIWLPNNYFETKSWGIKQDVTTFFNAANPITAIVNFTKTYTVIPQLAYGIKNYRGKYLSRLRKRQADRVELCTHIDRNIAYRLYHLHNDIGNNQHSYLNDNLPGCWSVIPLSFKHFQWYLSQFYHRSLRLKSLD